MSRIDPEGGGYFKDDDEPEAGGGQEINVPPPARDNVVPELVVQAMKGAMPLTRPLKPWEPQKLNPTHIQMIFDRAMGMKNHELQDKYEIDGSRVSVILGHPFAERILGAIFATLSERVTDPIERMRGYAHEMIDIKVDIARDKTTPKALKNAIASDWLDRIGYGARRQLEITTPQAPSVESENYGRLAEALREAKNAQVISYTRFVRNSSKKEGEEDESMPPAGENPGNGSSQTSGASPVGPLLVEDEQRKSA